MRDCADNVVVVCSIENIDPMGVHTGDSVTVAPAMTLTDREYQAMRDTAIAIMRAVGVDTGGCNIQFAVEPATGRMVVIEMNPRVSRSSALASKATGFPIAKIAARLAIGYTLDEIRQRHHRPDPGLLRARPGLRRGQGAAVRVREVPRGRSRAHHPHEERGRGDGYRPQLSPRPCKRRSVPWRVTTDRSAGKIRPETGRACCVRPRRRTTAGSPPSTRPCGPGASSADVVLATGIDPWFVEQIQHIEQVAEQIAAAPALDAQTLQLAKQNGFSDVQIAELRESLEAVVREIRWGLGVRPVYHAVDTCAAEFAARTPYLYSTYDDGNEVPEGTTPKVIILGSGPNRIGQGIEFDYACVHASFALTDAGYETVMVNCNPETVSTDYDTSGRLYFEPLTLEDVLEVVRAEQATGPVAGVIVQLGGQTPLGLARALEAARRSGGGHLTGGDPPGRGPRRVRPRAGRSRADRAAVRDRHVGRGSGRDRP